MILALLLAISLQAPTVVRFDPTRDLAGFEASYASEYRELYALDEYSALLGKEMSSADLADVRKRWRTDLAAGDAKLAELRADPAEETLWVLRRRMKRNTYFSKVALLEDRSVPGFVLFVQPRGKEAGEHAAAVAREHGPWLAKLRDVFEAEIVGPCRLSRASSRALRPIAILASEEEYRRYWSANPNPGSTAPFASYDPTLRLVVSYVGGFSRSGAHVEKRAPLLHALVVEMLSAGSTSTEGRPRALWLEEGLGSYFAWHEGEDPAALGDRKIRPAALERFVGIAQSKPRGRLVLHPLAELASLKSREDVDALVTRRSEAAELDRPPEDDVVDGFLSESTLWVHFMFAGRAGDLREPFLKYLAIALSVDAGPSALSAALGGQDLGALDREFLRWVAEEHARVFPQAATDPRALEGLFP